jgi:hypothetical protein
MLAIQSLQDQYTLCFSEDPALDLPEIQKINRDTASLDEASAVDALIKERNRKLKLARDTGNWAAITKPGETRTEFKFRAIGGQTLTWWQGQVTREDKTDAEASELMFRLALVDVDNLAKFEIKHDGAHKPQLLSLRSLNTLYGMGGDVDPKFGRRLVFELGSVVATRAIEGVPPLS